MTKSGAGLQGGTWPPERGGAWGGNGKLGLGGGAGAGAGWAGAKQVRRRRLDEAGPGGARTLGGWVPAGSQGAKREGAWQRGGPGGRWGGGEAGVAGRASRGSPPPSRGLQTRPLPVGPLVGRLVGRWVGGLELASRLSCSEVGGARERPANLSCPERIPAPRSVGSPHAPRPAARSGLRARVGALPEELRALECVPGARAGTLLTPSLARRLGGGYNSCGFAPNLHPVLSGVYGQSAPLQVPGWPWRCAGWQVTSVLCSMSELC